MRWKCAPAVVYGLDFEGCIVQLVLSSGAEEPYRTQYGRMMRSRGRDALQRKLRGALNRALDRECAAKPERIPLENTMAGWS